MKKSLCVLLSVLTLCASLLFSAEAKTDYVIDSPYADVIWSGDNAWGAYKGNLHTHSFVSDANTDYTDMILEYYNQGYDFLAMTDHGVTGKPWNERPTVLPLYAYQFLIGNITHRFSDSEYAALQDGTYPTATGTARGKGMTCVSGGNELNALTLTKCHVNGMFLPEHVGDNYLGYENDHEGAVRLTDEAGGLSFINHPGDWLHCNRDRGVCSDPENIQYFANILLKYDSCLGMEVFNEKNSVTPYDRVLWDNLLMECLPYGKKVIAFSNSDAHTENYVDSSFSVFMMKENTVAEIKETMQSGAFFCVTRDLRDDALLGPKTEIHARNSGLPYPEFTLLTVNDHKVTVRAKNCDSIQWVADGKVIASKDITASADETEYVIDLDTVDGAENFSYIRCQLFGEGGCTLSQALVIDNGATPKTYTPDTSVKAKFASVWHRICSLRIVVLVQIIIDAIK